ncbi:MAG: hypothetical protein IKP29_04195 [Pseudobutyrivibrio sp.]|nr:hypothetical protein [Pseudobutyrivibrio sp.]
MAFNISKIFEDVAPLSKISSKKEYEQKMNMFLSDRYELLGDLVAASDVAASSKEFCQGVTDEFKRFGKVRMGDLMNLNYFLIYYIFPAILKNEGENGASICDTLRDTWNSHFNSKINYTDYNTLMEGFQTKIFGIPIGKN